MQSVLKMELKKAFANKLFLCALCLAAAIAVYSAVFCIHAYHIFGQMDMNSAQITGYALNPELPGTSLFTQWIGKEFISPASSLFYLLMPLLAALGYGWSYCNERKSGYIKSIVTRTPRKNYFLSKYIAVFLSGGAVITIPILLNIMLVAAFVPAIQPDVFYDVYYGAHPWSTLTPLFYAHPFGYMLLKTAATFVFAGLIATLSLTVTFFNKNVFVVTLTPLFFLLLINYISNSLSNAPEISPIQFLHSGKVYVSLGVVLCEAILLFVVSFAVTVLRGKKNDIF